MELLDPLIYIFLTLVGIIGIVLALLILRFAVDWLQ